MIIIAGMTAYIEHVSVLLCSLGLYQNNFDDLIEQQLIPELLHFENTFNYNSI
jgi:plasmid rolling circle replication initiator protein Rep